MVNPDEGTPFTASASRLGELSGRQGQLEGLLAGDRFSVEPSAARRAAKACRDQVDRIDAALASARELARRDNFGDCAVGTSLAGKFAAKAGEGPDSMVALLTRSRDLLSGLALGYESAADRYEGVDTDSATRFRALTERTA